MQLLHFRCFPPALPLLRVARANGVWPVAPRSCPGVFPMWVVQPTAVVQCLREVFCTSLFSVKKRALSLPPNFNCVDTGRRVCQPFQRSSQPSQTELPLWKTAEALKRRWKR
jgi:hypothetical protein